MSNIVDPVLPDPPQKFENDDPAGQMEVPREERDEEYVEEEDNTHFAEIVLKDEAGQPVAGAPFKLRLPSGQIVRGSLDENGYAKCEKLPEGPYEVCFYRLDKAAWE